MSSIKISDLRLSGLDLLSDSENYLQELSSDDLIEKIVGGTSVIIIQSETIEQFMRQFQQ